MDTNTNTTDIYTTSERSAVTGRPWWRIGLIAGVAAAIVNLVIAMIASAADVSLEANSDAIPVAMFPVATLISTLFGLALAELLARRATRPARTFAMIAGGLAVLSLASPLAAGADAATVAVLTLSHVTAALIVVPTIVRQLPLRRD